MSGAFTPLVEANEKGVFGSPSEYDRPIRSTQYRISSTMFKSPRAHKIDDRIKNTKNGAMVLTILSL